MRDCKDPFIVRSRTESSTTILCLCLATFGVLITQPMQELYLFGFAMAAGILIDTFLVRGMLLPAILVLVHKGERTAANATAGVETGQSASGSTRIKL
ncbi:hypothetical protein [Cohnella soli]|uniref:Membrane transport protein MMPL domain-containing protein n=1 Tax=Cohnella soli TaxID=425005 RepID=A0ABW0I3L8_9BACL